ncbi:MAG: DUF2125 domain-containing protein [Azospirillum sp.]|nr:DUF2125 domain-containing protein [Azospirillum sp.]
MERLRRIAVAIGAGLVRWAGWTARHRRAMLAGASVVAVAGGGYIGWWWLAARTVERAVAEWAAAERALGGTVALQSLGLDGFPLSLRATVGAFSLTRSDGAAWRGDGLIAEAPPWHVTRPAFRLVGTQQIVISPPDRPPVLITARSGSGRADFALTGGLVEGLVRLGGVTATLPTLGLGDAVLTIAGFDAAFKQADAGPKVPADQVLNYRAALTDLEMPVGYRGPFGPRIQTIAFQGLQHGYLAGLAPAALEGWRGRGGTIDIESLRLIWGPLSMTVSGSLALDQELQPTGLLSADVAGALEAVDALVAAGLLREKEARLARSFLTALTLGARGADRPDAASPTGAAPVRLPLALRQHALWLGPFKIMPLPRINW